MSRVVLTAEAVEQSTYIVQALFYDEAGAAIAPISATWTLTNEYGLVVNGRQAVAISPLLAAVYLVLTGDDLGMMGEMDTGKRLLLVEATYNSSLGAGLNLREEIEFSIRPLVGVSS